MSSDISSLLTCVAAEGLRMPVDRERFMGEVEAELMALPLFLRDRSLEGKEEKTQLWLYLSLSFSPLSLFFCLIVSHPFVSFSLPFVLLFLSSSPSPRVSSLSPYLPLRASCGA
jgi:hypothetical protein